MHAMCVPCLKDQKRVSDFLELELDSYDPPLWVLVAEMKQGPQPE